MIGTLELKSASSDCTHKSLHIIGTAYLLDTVNAREYYQQLKAEVGAKFFASISGLQAV